MSGITRIRSIVYRIRWRSVIAVLLLVAVAALLFTSMPSGFRVTGGVGLKVKADPAKIPPGGSTTLQIELKNVESDEKATLVVEGNANDDDIYFEESYTQSYRSMSIPIGPQGTRKTSFKVKTKPGILEGRYTIDVTARNEQDPESREARTRVFLEVESRK
ncbi:MAG: hypothetical protein GF416_03980 [Candidatus Altiarchaeales archaeon]|nr:hypothetical protein [Candidatus Altiarchaeales archaeon]MBD3416278.1 hypothetical protein [Candidatus Altiarchaeales archaeon]